MPQPLVQEVVMRCFEGADHSGDKLTRHSRSGFIIFLHIAPIYYCSKRYNIFQTSTFGSEFMITKLACEYIRGLQYKLRMTGTRFSDPCFVYGNNKLVLYNTK